MHFGREFSKGLVGPAIERFGWLLILHMIYGLVAVRSSTVHGIVVYAVILWGFVRILNTRNATGIAHNLAAYLVGMEIVNRMVGGLNHEVVKYFVIGVLFTGMIVEKPWRSGVPLRFVAFLALLMPSVLLVSHPDPEMVRQMVSFNLSGPFCLAFSAMYFANRRMSIREYATMMGWIILPIVLAIVVIQYRAPTADELEFSYMMANTQFTGGAGSNQVSTVLGAGMVVLGLGFLLGYRVNVKRPYDVVLLAVLLYHGLLTFSRGGMLAAGISMTLAVGIHVNIGTKMRSRIRALLVVPLVVIATILVFDYANSITGDNLAKRYEGQSGTAGKVNMTSGRDRIMMADLHVFLENPFLGTGPGMAVIPRSKYYGLTAAAHSEITRLLAEHGILGLFALMMLVGTALHRITAVRRDRQNLVLSVAMISLAFMSMLHNAMRLSVPGFIYGIALCVLVQDRGNADPDDGQGD